MQPRIFVVFALRSEVGRLLESDAEIGISGVDKLGICHYLTKKIITRRDVLKKSIDLVVNMGIVRSTKIPGGSVVMCREFTQRDLDFVDTGLLISGNEVFRKIKFPRVIDFLPEASCGSGESFDRSYIGVDTDVVDMEGYSIAKVCHLEDIPFVSVKYVTEGVTEKFNWSTEMQKAGEQFLCVYQKMKTEQLNLERPQTLRA